MLLFITQPSAAIFLQDKARSHPDDIPLDFCAFATLFELTILPVLLTIEHVWGMVCCHIRTSQNYLSGATFEQYVTNCNVL